MESSIAKNFIFELKIFFFNFLEKFFGKILQVDEFYQKPIVVLLKPLGIGDLIMISPIFSILLQRYSEIIVVSDYENIFENDQIKWLSVDQFMQSSVAGFYIFPMHCYANFKLFRQKSLPIVGYFLTNKFNRNGPKFDGARLHYFDKVKHISTYLGLTMNNPLFYPNLKQSDFKVPEEYICISPFSNWETRTTPPENFMQVLKKINLSMKEIVIVGGSNKDEKKYNHQFTQMLISEGYQAIDLTGCTNFKELVFVIKNAEIFMGNDSGPSHIASIMSPKTIVFDGCVPASLRMPLNPSLRKNTKFYDLAFHCPSYPCYNGFTKPHCVASEKYNCMKHAPTIKGS